MNATSARHPVLASPRRARGFTLVELMVTIAVLAILLSLGIPSFARLIASTRMSNQANELVGTLNLARSEAIRRGQSVSVRATSNGSTFHGGWSVFTDADGNGEAATPVTTTDGTAIRNFAAVGGTTTITRVTRTGSSPNFTYATSSADDNEYVVYDARGGVPGGAAFFKVCDSANPTLSGRIIQASLAGKTSVDSKVAACS